MTQITVPYVTFMKHAQKITRAKSIVRRPVLQGVIHRNDYVAVTDSHRLYFATGLYSGEEKNVDPKTGATVNEGNYPDVERLIQDESDATVALKHLDVTKAYEALRAIEIAVKQSKIERMVIVVGSEGVTFSTDEFTDFYVEYKDGKVFEEEVGRAYVSIKYMKEALHVLKDAKAQTFALNFFGEHHPIQIVAGNFKALITPIRKG